MDKRTEALFGMVLTSAIAGEVIAARDALMRLAKGDWHALIRQLGSPAPTPRKAKVRTFRQRARPKQGTKFTREELIFIREQLAQRERDRQVEAEAQARMRKEAYEKAVAERNAARSPRQRRAEEIVWEAEHCERHHIGMGWFSAAEAKQRGLKGYDPRQYNFVMQMKEKRAWGDGDLPSPGQLSWHDSNYARVCAQFGAPPPPPPGFGGGR